MEQNTPLVPVIGYWSGSALLTAVGALFWHRPFHILGLTGGIACGKSSVTKTLRRDCHAVVLDFDAMSRETMARGQPAWLALKAHPRLRAFIREEADGELDRKALGDAAFADPALLKELSQVTRPYIARLFVKRLLYQLFLGAVDTVVLDNALLYEVGLDRICTRVCCVVTPAEQQISRLQARDDVSQEQAEQRIASQQPQSVKASRAQDILDNSGSVQELEQATREWWTRATTHRQSSSASWCSVSMLSALAALCKAVSTTGAVLLVHRLLQ